MENDLIYLDTYVLQQDMRIRMPKAVLANMRATKGQTMFAIYYNVKINQLVLKIAEPSMETNNE